MYKRKSQTFQSRWIRQTTRFYAGRRCTVARTGVVALIIGVALCSSVAWAQDAQEFDPTKSAFYTILEGTKNEAVAVGRVYVQRWARDDKDDNQKWLMVPVGKDLYHIRSKGAASGDFRFMSVDPQGNVRLWGIGQHFDEGQTFGLVHLGGGKYEIRVEKNAYCIGTGSTGIMVRWECNDPNSQTFRFLATKTWPKPVPRQGKAQPGQIEPPPEFASLRDPPPESTTPVLIGETIVPAVYVNSDKIPDKLQQIEAFPYYTLKREQYWTRMEPYGYYLKDAGFQELTKKITITTGTTNESSNSIEDTLGITITANAGFSYEGASAGLSTQITKELKVAKSSSTKRMEQTTMEVTVTRPAGTTFALASWKLVDKYTLLRAKDGSEVKTWKVFKKNDYETSFPLKAH